MPVEATRIKGKLRELFPKVNLSTRRLDEISARLAKKAADEADDDAIAQLVNDANDFMPFAEIAKEDDKIRTLEANQKSADPKPTDPQPEPQPEPTPKPTDAVPAWAQSLLNEVKELKQGKIMESKSQQARKLFEENPTFKGLTEKGKEHFFNQIKLDSEVSFDDQIKDLESTYTELVQVKADSADYSGKPPAGGADNKPSDDELDKIVSIAGR